jgi:hypothetical protein
MKKPIRPKKPKEPIKQEKFYKRIIKLSDLSCLKQDNISLYEFYNFCLNKAKEQNISDTKDIFISKNYDYIRSRVPVLTFDLMAYKLPSKEETDEYSRNYNEEYKIYTEKLKQYHENFIVYEKQCKEYEEYLKKIEYENALKIVDKYKKENK